MQEEQSTPKVVTATLPRGSDNVERAPAITDADEFLPLPHYICTFKPCEDIPW